MKTLCVSVQWFERNLEGVQDDQSWSALLSGYFDQTDSSNGFTKRIHSLSVGQLAWYRPIWFLLLQLFKTAGI